MAARAPTRAEGDAFDHGCFKEHGCFAPGHELARDTTALTSRLGCMSRNGWKQVKWGRLGNESNQRSDLW